MPFEKFVGQDRVKMQLRIAIHEGSMGKMPHLGIFATKGMGKSFISELIAEEMGAELIYINSTSVETPMAFLKDINKARSNPHKHFLVFLDEAHELPKGIQENLLSVLEEPATLCFSSPTKKTYNTESGKTKTFQKGDIIKAVLPTNISFILGTTHRGCLRDTILDRIMKITFDDYTEDEMVEIIKRNTNLDIPNNVMIALSRIGRNPRGAKGRLKTFAAFLDMNNAKKITMDHFKAFCNIYSIEEDGCTKEDLLCMSILREHGVSGLKSIVAMSGLPEEDIITLVEPFLLQKGYIKITSRGRELSDKGNARMGSDANNNTLVVLDG